jgi:hypothetical protein
MRLNKKAFIISFLFFLIIYSLIDKLILSLKFIQYNPKKFNFDLAFKNLLIDSNEIILKYVDLPYEVKLYLFKYRKYSEISPWAYFRENTVIKLIFDLSNFKDKK